MKKLFSIFSLALFTGAILSSCEKETELNAPYQPVTGEVAQLKINYNSNYAANPGVHIKLDNNRVSNVLTARTPFPGGGFNTGGGSTPDYLAVQPGLVNLKIAIPNAGRNTDSVTLFADNITLEANKHYTAHITDTGANTKIVLLEDNLTRPDTGQSRYRFINLMPNVPAIDLYYGTTLVASNVAYLSATNYFDLPVPTTHLAWTIRPAGAAPTSTALATYTSSNTSLSRRVYTAFAVGYNGQGSTSVRRPFISFLLNN